MLTGDLNVATVEWIVQYKIADPYKYLFKLRDVEATFRMMTEASMRQVVGDHSVTELLTVGREAIARQGQGAAVQPVQALRQRHHRPAAGAAGRRPARAGQAVVQRGQPGHPGARAGHQRGLGRIQPGDPPGPRPGRAALQAAEGYAIDRVNRAKGEAQRFLALHEEYRKAPEVTRTRLHLETMSAVLPKAGQKLVLDEQGARASCPAALGSSGAEPRAQGEAMSRATVWSSWWRCWPCW